MFCGGSSMGLVRQAAAFTTLFYNNRVALRFKARFSGWRATPFAVNLFLFSSGCVWRETRTWLQRRYCDRRYWHALRRLLVDRLVTTNKYNNKCSNKYSYRENRLRFLFRLVTRLLIPAPQLIIVFVHFQEPVPSKQPTSVIGRMLKRTISIGKEQVGTLQV